jgi:Xaa-Pro dipeptidase
MVNVFSRDEIGLRLERLRGRLHEQSVGGALFVYPTDIFYFSGTRQNSALWIPAAGEPVLLVRKSFKRAATESLISDTRPFPSSKELPAIFGTGIRSIGLTMDVMPAQHVGFYSGLLPGLDFVDISQINRELRSVKSEMEQECLRQSGRKFSEIFSEIPHVFKPGMREVDLAAEFEYLLRREGNAPIVRMRAFGQDIVGIVSSGEAASGSGCFDGPVSGRGVRNNAPFGASTAYIKPNTPILIDYPGIFSGYIADMTRMFVVGELEPMLKDAFDTAIRVQDWLADNLIPGNICEDLYYGALRIAEESGLGEYFMGVPGENAKFVGHGVGLELDEFPVLAKSFKHKLQEGNVIALEPKFVFPGKGAVGIENTWLVTGAGSEKLTPLSDEIVYL